MKFFVKQENFLNQIPQLPGVYRFYNANDEILYVGKALNLFKRIKSYFVKTSNLSPRIHLMVSKISAIELTITDNEVSALILENNLIKSLKPKYNIIFRDDKTYPLIKISKHTFPQIDSYRGNTNTPDYFIGPYTNAAIIKQSIETIQRLFKLRTCSDQTFTNRSRPCMLYQIKKCLAPCVGKVSEAEYNSQVKLAIELLEGKFHEVANNLQKQMEIASNSLEFELAASLRDKLTLINQLGTSQIINSYALPINMDLILIEEVNNQVFIYLIILRNGTYVGDKHFKLQNPDGDLNQVIEVFLENYYLTTQNTRKIYLNKPLKPEFKALLFKAFALQITTSLGTQSKQLLKMGQNNLTKIIENTFGNQILIQAAIKLADLIQITKINRIECIDTSHNHGENTVTSIVVYQDGIIDHNQYRKFNLSNQIQGNDIMALEEVLVRRLKHETLMPELFLIDGGQAQFNLVKNILIKHKLYDKIKVASIFKGEKRDPKYDKLLIDNIEPLSVSDAPDVFKLIQTLRDEAHRFAITGHRKKQIKKMAVSQLDEIPNLGPRKKRALITYFGSVKEIANASKVDLQKVDGIGATIADQVYSYFH